MRIKRLSYLSLTLFALSSHMLLATDLQVITSPDSFTSLEIREDNGQLSYSVKYRDKVVIEPSLLELLPGGKLAITSTEETVSDSVWKPVWGQFSEIQNHYNGLTIHLNVSKGDEVRLECRVFDGGLGMRFTSGGKVLSSINKINFRTEFRWSEDSNLYWPNGERDPVGPACTSTGAIRSESPIFAATALKN